MTGRPNLAVFEGRWVFERRILHANDRPVTATGEVIFAPDPQGLIYDETGTLRLADGSSFAATRRYLWRPDGAVLFEDGRDFHTILQDRETAVHLCGADTYVVEYDFLRWPVWISRWSVQGPKKDYVMTTEYQRSASRAEVN